MTFIKKISTFTSLCLLTSITTFNVIAHERFIIPRHTLLSGDKAQAVTLMASISNDIFHPDRALGDSNTGADVGELKNLFKVLQHSVIAPDGSVSNNTRWQAFQRFSVADVWLKESGTYRIGLIQPDVPMTTFKKSDGTPWRLFGKNPAIPEGATDIVRRTTSSRVETFVSVNSPTMAAVEPTGQGVELSGETHPNDLYAGESASFQLFFKGKPMAIPTSIKVIKAGTRHRNNRNEVSLAVNKDGVFTFTPQTAGFYFLAAETSVKVPQPAEYDVKHYSLYLTLEVFPE